MSFPKHTTTYGRRPTKDTSASPYDRAKREWDERIGSARVQAFHWRLIALVSLVGMLGLGVTLAFVTIRKDIKTYVIEIDQLGKPARITLAGDRYRPDAAHAAYFIGQLVRLVRARPLDPVVVRDNWKRAYGFLAGDAVHTMNAYAVSDPPLRAIEGRPLTRTVAITNVLQKSADTYQVRWLETAYVGGVPQQPEQRTGLFQIEIKPPRTEADVFRNPLGMYVVSFSWSREFTDAVVSDPQPASQPHVPTSQESDHEMPED